MGPCACHARMGPQLPASMVLTVTYEELHPGSSWVPICLRNLSACPFIIPTKVVTGKVTPTNWVLPVAFPAEVLGETTHDPCKDWILEELNLQGLEEWPKEEQDQARKLLVRWEHLFANSDMDLGKMSPHQALDKTDWPDALQGTLLVNTPHMYNDWNRPDWNLSLLKVSCFTGRSHVLGTLSLPRE